MSAMSDAIITYAILRKFTTPIKDTHAFALGLVDEHGVPTEKSKHDGSETARDAYTLLDRLVFKLKRMWQHMPAFAKLIGGYAAALAFLKEDVEQNEFSVFEHLDPNAADYWGGVLLGESVVDYKQFEIVRIAENATLLRSLVEAYQSGTQDSFVFEDGEGPAPSGNAVSTGQVQGLATEPVITKKKQKEIQSDNWESSPTGRKVEPIL